MNFVKGTVRDGKVCGFIDKEGVYCSALAVYSFLRTDHGIHSQTCLCQKHTERIEKQRDEERAKKKEERDKVGSQLFGSQLFCSQQPMSSFVTLWLASQCVSSL
jgi:hypothetical protein